MKLTIEQADLATAAKQAAAVAPARTTMPILGQVLVQASDDLLTLTATDLDLRVSVSVPAQVAEPGAICIDAGRLSDLARNLPKGAQINLTLTDTHVALTCGRSRYKFATLPVADFPPFSLAELGDPFTLPVATLKTTLGRLRYAVLTDGTRLYLSGCVFHGRDDGTLSLAATDGHQLAVVHLEVAHPLGRDLDSRCPILPVAAMDMIGKLFSDKGDINVAFAPNGAQFMAAGIEFTSKLLDAQFPDYLRVIPRDQSITVTTDGPALRRAVERAHIAASEISSKTRSRIIALGIAPDTLTLGARDNVGNAVLEPVAAEATADTHKEPKLLIGIQPAYLSNTLRALDADTLEIFATDSRGALEFRRLGDPSIQCIVMPARIGPEAYPPEMADGASDDSDSDTEEDDADAAE